MNELSQTAMVNSEAAKLLPPEVVNEFLKRLEQITDHLVWIRWELALLLLVAVFLVGIVMVSIRTVVDQATADFSKTGQRLFNREEYAEVVRLGLQYVNTSPGDANAHWLLAQAQMRLGDFKQALIHAKKTQELQPDWERRITGLTIAYLEEQVSEAGSKPELRVVSPNPSPQTDAPPSDGAPLS